MSDPNIYPVLRYADAGKALEWLAKAFGFKENFVVRGDDGTVNHAQMSLGPGIVMFATARDSLGKDNEPDPMTTRHSIYVYVEDVAAHAAQAEAAGAEITRALENTDYGSREYAARDFEGNHWSFGSYQPRAGA
ncbi:MAG: glyoxalase/bleomycin resistance protein/dioxygenase [Amycolatopsis sp.]|uniref:VOC family protein n=1 Tax=Amycolatopsis sp. TaxID=37632 RepID=UPI002602ECC3|nr:VOC family protein [Amycolatopsis sp.]MCU1686962.1 glyoxalase/bleomycin resistance protein/dioxygenase [Amycolatopsis sp.]